jgi:predicted transcriptional regulator
MCGVTQIMRIVILSSELTKTSGAYIAMVGDIVSAYISNNHVASADLPSLIGNVHAAISALAPAPANAQAAEPAIEKLTSAQIRKSVTRDAIISFIDGKGYKTLKRHLTVHGLDPNSYRAKFGLPSDYPMVAPSYSEVRSGLAKSLGLGVQNGRRAADKEAEVAPKRRKRAA